MESYLSVDDNCGGVDISSSNCMEDGVCCTVKGVLLTEWASSFGSEYVSGIVINVCMEYMLVWYNVFV